MYETFFTPLRHSCGPVGRCFITDFTPSVWNRYILEQTWNWAKSRNIFVLLKSVRHYCTRPAGDILKGGPQLADRAETADHIHKDATDRYAPCLRALLLFARPIVNIWYFYYCVVLTILNVIPNGITCIYKILEIN